MKLYAWQNIFFLTLVLACGYANAGPIAKRDGNSGLSGMVDSIIHLFVYVPFFGDDIVGILQWLVQAIGLFEIATNGALGRLLGGALPCDISLDDGLTCSGLTNNGGFAAVLMDVLNGLPPYLLPGILKWAMDVGIGMFIDPVVDVLFGGVAVDS